MTPVRKPQNWLPSIFNDFFGNEWVEKRAISAPAVNILETEAEYRVEIAAPGLTRDDFKVELCEGNELVVSVAKRVEREIPEKGETANNKSDSESSKSSKSHPRKGTYLRREFAYTEFRQSMILPENVEKDRIAASVENGVLMIDIPKREVVDERPSTRTIEVK